MNLNHIPVNALTSKAAIYGIAAELIQRNMEAQPNKDYRIGCCAAFSQIIQSAERDFSVDYAERAGAIDLVYTARREFADLYRTDGSRITKDTVYWMGTRSDMGQKRRMAALLTAAKVVK